MKIKEIDFVENKFVEWTPGDYAALFGSSPICSINLSPCKKDDGVYFYNFGSSNFKKNKKWYKNFIAAINRTINLFQISAKNKSCTTKEKKQFYMNMCGLEQLKEHVESLIENEI